MCLCVGRTTNVNASAKKNQKLRGIPNCVVFQVTITQQNNKY